MGPRKDQGNALPILGKTYTNRQAMRITDNVVDMMMGRIKRLPLETQAVLSLAAAIGNTFELRILSQVSEVSPSRIAETLLPAISSGLVIQLGQDFKFLRSSEEDNSNVVYQFLHDRVQQASYEIINPEESQRIHIKLARLLLDRLTENEIEEKLFGKKFLRKLFKNYFLSSYA